MQLCMIQSVYALAVAGLCLLLAQDVRAQVQSGPEGANRWKQANDDTSVLLRQMTITPAEETRPALKYSLRWPAQDSRRGNAVSLYYRAFALMNAIPSEQLRKADKLLERSYEELVAADTAALLQSFEPVIATIRDAVAREECRWEWFLDELPGDEKLNFAMPELSSARVIARLLDLRAQWQIGSGDLAGALDSIQLNYEMAQDIAQESTLVGSLVAIAITSVASDDVARFIATPGAPNLYWALAELPRPVIDIRESLRKDLALQASIFGFDDADSILERTEEQWRLHYQQVTERIQKISGTPNGNTRNDSLLWLVTIGYPRAKRNLVERGLDRSVVEAMPVGEVVARFQVLVNQEAIEDVAKLTFLPFDQAQRPLDVVEQKIAETTFQLHGPSSEILPIGRLLMPAMNAARNAETRCTAELNALQTVEAIRMHVAHSQGHLPETLADIQVVPVPRNPFTNGTFEYQLKDGVAILEYDSLPGLRRRFEIRLHGAAGQSGPASDHKSD